MTIELVIAPGGNVHAIYDDAFDFACLGETEIRRASFVEPDYRGGWFADLSPVNGPKLGPFDKRGLALDAEVAWLRQHPFH